MWRDEHPLEGDYICGLDLAQGGSDFTALAVLQRAELRYGQPADYLVIHLQRWRDRRTARIPEQVANVWRQLIRFDADRVFALTGIGSHGQPSLALVVDQTGVGPFGLDPLREAGFSPTGIVIHGGDAVTHPDPHTYRVPKRDLAGVVHTLLESDRLRMNEELPDARVLKSELENFRAKITLTGHDRYEAGGGEEWRVGAHDDLVLAVAVAAWMGERHSRPKLDPAIVAAWRDVPRFGVT